MNLIVKIAVGVFLGIALTASVAYFTVGPGQHAGETCASNLFGREMCGDELVAFCRQHYSPAVNEDACRDPLLDAGEDPDTVAAAVRRRDDKAIDDAVDDAMSDTGTSVAAPAAESVSAMTVTDEFSTPSRGITCAALEADDGATHGVRCRVLSAMSQSGVVPVAEVKDAGGARIHDVVAPDAVAEGDTMTYGSLRAMTPGLPDADRSEPLWCASSPSGLRCENVDGHGFMVSRESQDAF